MDVAKGKKAQKLIKLLQVKFVQMSARLDVLEGTFTTSKSLQETVITQVDKLGQCKPCYTNPFTCLTPSLFTSKLYPLEHDESIAIDGFVVDDGLVRFMPLFDAGIENVGAIFTFHDVLMKDYSPIPILEDVSASFVFHDVVQRILVKTNLDESVAASFIFHNVVLKHPINTYIHDTVAASFIFHDVVQEFV